MSTEQNPLQLLAVMEHLRAIGAQTLFDRTHIAPENLDALLSGRLEQFSAVQFNGFVTIIEREFELDLSLLRDEFIHNVQSSESPLSEQENDPFANAFRAKKRQRLQMGILALLLVVAIVAGYLVIGDGSKDEKIELNNTALEKARENIASMNTQASQSRQAETDAIQASHQHSAAEAVPSEAMPEYDDVIITPHSKVWLGVIDATTLKRQTRTSRAPWRLDGSKSWLIVTGHGLLALECGGTQANFSQRDRLLFLYEDGSCRQIDADEFKARNRGRIW